IKILAEQGIKISIIHGENDLMFPMSEIQKMAENENVYEFHSMIGNDHHSIYFGRAGDTNGYKNEAEYIEEVVLMSMESAAGDNTK
ncbi:MAG: hypothetical protein WCO09_04635, partial [bacterium]